DESDPTRDSDSSPPEPFATTRHRDGSQVPHRRHPRSEPPARTITELRPRCQACVSSRLRGRGRANSATNSNIKHDLAYRRFCESDSCPRGSGPGRWIDCSSATLAGFYLTSARSPVFNGRPRQVPPDSIAERGGE